VVEPRGRIRDLIDYVVATERDKMVIVTDYLRHEGLRWRKPELYGLPGVELDVADGDDGPWLRISRLSPVGPPAADLILRPWLIISNDPQVEPRLKLEVVTAALEEVDGNKSGPTIRFEDYEHANAVTTAFGNYLNGVWTRWAEAESPRRASMKVYGDLFALQRIESADTGVTTEMVWGVGIASWRTSEGSLRYPLLTIPLEVTLLPTHALEVRPRSEREPRPEFEVLEKIGADSREAAEWGRRTVAALADSDIGLSPFRSETFAPFLKDAVSRLDSQGRFIAEGADASELAGTEHLCVDCSWVIFVRERRATELMADLERLREEVTQSTKSLPPCVLALATEPSSECADETILVMRGLSTVPGVTSADGSGADLFFPLPFNAEQVSVMRRLANQPGVVVQGPPGTGKTHTIANIVCHYLATGKRVLVTSQKSDALRVLRDKLPEEIRPLAVALLDSDREGLRQFQDSVGIIGV
jgi:hypothetical protein